MTRTDVAPPASAWVRFSRLIVDDGWRPSEATIVFLASTGAVRNVLAQLRERILQWRPRTGTGASSTVRSSG
jgi:hypothetical protein